MGRLAGELEEELGLATVGDLLDHYPRRYLDLDQVSELDDLVVGELVMVVAKVVPSAPLRRPAHRRKAVRTEVSARLAAARSG